MPVRVVVEPPGRAAFPRDLLPWLRARASRMLKAAGLADPALGDPGAVDAGLTLTGDAGIRALNRTYRRKDKPTDVLAFAMREGDTTGLPPGLLGDVVISVETAAFQARAARHDLPAEVLFLWSHGLCHLLGYDHRTDREERLMNLRMTSLLAEAARRGRVGAA